MKVHDFVLCSKREAFAIYIYIIFKYFIHLPSERGEEREKHGDRRGCVRDTATGCLSLPLA